MLELFSRVPDVLDIGDDSHLTPIPVEYELSSLSAILLKEEYYQWIQAGKRIVEGVNIVGAEHLIPLKARAWLDISARRASGEKIDSRKIKKHRSDVFRLFPVLTPEPVSGMPKTVQDDLRKFIDANQDLTMNLKDFGVGGRSVADVFTALRNIYGI